MTTDTLPTTLEMAITAFNSGEYPQAKKLCQQVLQQAPQHPEALHLLGLLEATHGNLSTAVDLLQQAIAIQPTPLFYRNLANLFTQHQQWAETLATYQQWGQQHPDDYEAWWNMATQAYQMGQLATSAYAWQHLLQRHPNSPEIYNNLANIQCEQGELQAARHNYQQALNLNPDFATGWCNLGRVSQQQGDFSQAWNCYQEALQRNPHFAEVHNELGIWHQSQQQPEQAINCYRVALAVKPQWFDALNNLGLAYQALKQWKEAEQMFQEALAVRPHSEIAQVNLGNLLVSSGNAQAARGYFQKALEHHPQMTAAHVGLGNVCVTLAQIKEGLHHYNQALSYHPHDPDAHYNRAFAHLALGHYLEGFADYEWRLQHPEFPSRAFPQSQWTGEPSACRLLLHAEQGLGDTLQMLRFIPLVAARVPHLVLECPQSLCSLVSLFPGVTQVIPQGQPLPDFDIHLPLMSLPYVLGITLENLPQYVPVLGFPPKKPTPPTSRFTVGIVWAGNPDHLRDRHRSCSLADFSPLFDLENISFVSFQMGSAAEALKTTSFPVTDLSPHIQDFSDTTTLLQDVDLVISVDTALAHLAGTLGKPVWLLLNFTPDWRWLLEREDSPWYPTFRLFRQKQAGDWASVFQEVKTALSQWNQVKNNVFKQRTSSVQKSSCALTTLEMAVSAFNSGEYPQAKMLCQQVLQQAPQHPDALHLLGLLEATRGNLPTAVDLLQKAIAIQPTPLFYRNLANLFTQHQQWAETLATYQQWGQHHPDDYDAWWQTAILAHQLGQLATSAHAWQHLLQHYPNSPEIYNNLANIQCEQGELPAAQHNYQQALNLNPDFATGWCNLGRVCQQQGDFSQAWNCYQEALQRNPHFAEVHNELGIWHQSQQQPEQAMAAYQQALHLDPGLADAYSNIGSLLYQQKLFNQAINFFQQALQRAPNRSIFWKKLGSVLNEQGNFTEAQQAYDQALALAQDDALEIHRAIQLPPIYRSHDDLAYWRQRYQDAMHRLQQRPLCVKDPVVDINVTNFYLPYQGLGDRELQQQLAQICLQACPDLDFTAPYVGRRPSHRPIRLGFVSHHLRNHTIGKLMGGLIKQLATRPEFEVTVFFAGPTQDPLSHSLGQVVHHTVELPSIWQAARNQIMQHEPDILFYPDLGMEPLTYFLAFSRLATLQCTTWGHPITSGIPAMDAFFSSQALETPVSVSEYSEQLIQLQHLIPYYDCPTTPVMPATREDYGLPEQAHLYVCAQSLFKFHPDFDAILGGILRQDPHGVVVLLSGLQPLWQTCLQQRWQTTLADVQNRLVFVPRQDQEGYLNLLRVADVALDPLHFGGGNTSYEAFAMGIPVVTLPSDYLKARLTYGMYQQMGWVEGVATSPGHYVDLALRFGQDHDYNRAQRQQLKESRDHLFQDPLTVVEVAETLYRLWEKKLG